LRPQSFNFTGLTQNFRGHRLDLQKAHPSMERHILSTHWFRSDTRCDLWRAEETKKR